MATGNTEITIPNAGNRLFLVTITSLGWSQRLIILNPTEGPMANIKIAGANDFSFSPITVTKIAIGIIQSNPPPNSKIDQSISLLVANICGITRPMIVTKDKVIIDLLLFL